MTTRDKADPVTIGRVVAVFGVRGWLKVESYTRPTENLLGYRDWQLRQGKEWRDVRLISGRSHGNIFVVQLADASGQVWTDRDQAASLIGADIAVPRQEMPEPAPGQYYWADLIGLRVEHVDGRPLGEVSGLMETGAHDVLVVKGERERLIPFVHGHIVQQIDRPAGRIIVDWDPEY